MLFFCNKCCLIRYTFLIFRSKRSCPHENVCNMNHCQSPEQQRMRRRSSSVRMSPDSGYQGERTVTWLGGHIDRDVMMRSTREDCIRNAEMIRGDTKESFERQELTDMQRNFGPHKDERFSDTISEVNPMNSCPTCRP